MNEPVDDRLAALTDVAASLDLRLERTDAQRLLAYLDLLQRWNRTYNLTAVRDPAEMLTQHIADCLAVVGPLRREMAGRAHPRLLDVGSGGGLPGVVLAILCPDWEVVCVDTVGKKAAFIQQAALEVKAANLQARHARVESLPPGGFDIVTSRAFASLADFVGLTRRHLKPDGLWAAMKGKDPDEEIAALPPEVQMFHVEHLTVPRLNADRCIVWMRPTP